MKTRVVISSIASVLLVLCIQIVGYSQVPQGFSYQAVIRNSTGQPIASQSVKVHIQLTNQLGTLIHYGEEHTLTTSLLGVANLTIGEGTLKQGTLAAVPWQNGNIFIKVEIDPTGTSGYQSMGDPMKLNSVPYALYAENAKEVVSPSDAIDTDPIFVVRNKIGQIVFAVYQSGVRVNVEQTAVIKGAKGGFAVGGLTSKNTIDPPEYFRIYPDSARIYLKPSKGAKGGFAVGGLTSKGKSNSDQFLNLTTENYFIGHEAGKSITTGLYNSFFGYQAGLSNTAGRSNIFIGYQSGYSNIGDVLGTTGHLNIFVGNQSGFSNTTGLGNIFLGEQSGFQNTEGSRDVFIGVQSGQANLSGLYNVFIGYQSGCFNTKGSRNVLLGNAAGFHNTEGQSNIMIGDGAGWDNSTGSGNVFIGGNTGASNNTGAGNVFLGVESGYYNIGGHDNTFLGKSSGFSNGEGFSNVYIGDHCGERNVIGDNNVLLGSYAGGNYTSGSTNVMIGSYAGFLNAGNKNVFIGPGAGYSSEGDNKLYIANSTSTPLIYGDFSTQRLGINTTTPSEALEVFNGSTTGKYTTSGWTHSSDVRLKENIIKISNTLDDVLKLQGVKFNFINDKAKTKQIGFIAQDVEKIFPEFVVTGNDGYKSISYGQIDAVLVEAIKEQQLQIEKQKNELESIKAKLELIEAMLKK